MHRIEKMMRLYYYRVFATEDTEKVMIPAGRYEELQFSYDYGTDDEAVWCFHDGKLCAIYDKQGRKIATAPIPIEDCAYDGGYD